MVFFFPGTVLGTHVISLEEFVFDETKLSARWARFTPPLFVASTLGGIVIDNSILRRRYLILHGHETILIVFPIVLLAAYLDLVSAWWMCKIIVWILPSFSLQATRFGPMQIRQLQRGFGAKVTNWYHVQRWGQSLVWNSAVDWTSTCSSTEIIERLNERTETLILTFDSTLCLPILVRKNCSRQIKQWWKLNVTTWHCASSRAWRLMLDTVGGCSTLSYYPAPYAQEANVLVEA